MKILSIFGIIGSLLLLFIAMSMYRFWHETATLNDMQHYKIRQGSFKEIKKQMLIRTLPIMLIAVTVGISISSIN